MAHARTSPDGQNTPRWPPSCSRPPPGDAIRRYSPHRSITATVSCGSVGNHNARLAHAHRNERVSNDEGLRIRAILRWTRANFSACVPDSAEVPRGGIWQWYSWGQLCMCTSRQCSSGCWASLNQSRAKGLHVFRLVFVLRTCSGHVKQQQQYDMVAQRNREQPSTALQLEQEQHWGPGPAAPVCAAAANKVG